jgi:hypothetical protein
MRTRILSCPEFLSLYYLWLSIQAGSPGFVVLLQVTTPEKHAAFQSGLRSPGGLFPGR